MSDEVIDRLSAAIKTEERVAFAHGALEALLALNICIMKGMSSIEATNEVRRRVHALLALAEIPEELTLKT